MIVRESTCLQRQFRDCICATQERALESGHTIIIENLGESLDAVLAPVIQRATIKRGRPLYVKVGDSEVEFHPDFRRRLGVTCESTFQLELWEDGVFMIIRASPRRVREFRTQAVPPHEAVEPALPAGDPGGDDTY